MIGLLCFALAVLASPFKSKLRLEAENAALRHQLIVLRRKLRGRVRLANSDRWFFVQLYRWFPSILQVLAIIRPETLIHCEVGGDATARRMPWMLFMSMVEAPVGVGGKNLAVDHVSSHAYCILALARTAACRLWILLVTLLVPCRLA